MNLRQIIFIGFAICLGVFARAQTFIIGPGTYPSSSTPVQVTASAFGATGLGTTGSVIVSNGANIHYTASSDLGFGPGFTVQKGGVFTAGISPQGSPGGTSTYAWRPSTSLIGQTLYLYGNLQDQDVNVGSFSGQRVLIEAPGTFNLLSPLTTTSSNYVYVYLYNGKAYGGSVTLQPGGNVVNISTPISGGTAVHQVTINLVSSLLTTQGYTYDELNRVKTYTNGNGITTTYIYSLAGNLTQTSATNGDVINYTYGSLNRKTSMVDATGTTFYGYDDLDRVTPVTYSASGNLNDPNNLVLGYQFDNANHVTGMTYPGGEQVNYGYDNAGRLLTVQDVVGSSTYNYKYQYYPTTGQLQNLTWPNGVVTSYGYDNAGRLNDIKHVNSSGATLAEYSYTGLDSNGNATALLTTFSDGSKKQELYGYDSLQRLIQVTYGATATAVPNTDPTVGYTYDNNGNRLTQTTTVNGAVTQKLTYTYGSTNQLDKIVDQNSVVQSSYIYDSAGNRIEKLAPAGNTYYAYDERNLLISEVTPTDYVQNLYNGSGQRVQKTVDGVTTQFIIDPSQKAFQVVQERSAGAVTKSYIYGMERLQSNPASGSPSFYLTDRLGSVRLVTSSTGAITASYNYDAFGASR
jgi:YD repeat-containing protein